MQLVKSGSKSKKTLPPTSSLTKGKKKTVEDKQKLSELELIRRVQHAVTQSPDKWNSEMQETINQVFEKYDDLKTAYQISQDFKKWYDYSNRFKTADVKTFFDGYFVSDFSGRGNFYDRL